MSGPVKLSEPQRALLCELAAGCRLTAELSGGWPSLDSPRSLLVKQHAIAACVRRGWVERGERDPEHKFTPRYVYEITDAGRRALAEGGPS